MLCFDRKDQETNMFIAMNRFRVAKGCENSFEQVWMSRDSHLDKVPGFVEFHLLNGPEA
jgi:heme-degrading monooxygenase HmoA